MLKAYFLLLLGILSQTVFAQQEPRFFIGIGTTGTSRVWYNDTEFSKSEAQELRDLEVVTPSYHFHIGYTFLKTSDVSFQLGAEYRRTRFGSKIYRLPNDVHNTTPQYGKKKETIVQKQMALFLETTLHQIKPLWASSLFFKLGIIRNWKNYHISRNTYDEMNQKGFTGTKTSPRFVPRHRTDIHLTAGLNYQIFEVRNNPIYLQPSISIFASAYQTHWGYLYFGKDFAGHLWEFGITARYAFGKWK